jgi:hypothetical protein
VVDDQAFDGAAQRRACEAIGAEAVIPAKANRVDPEPLDEAANRERNRVERRCAKLKEFHRVATRYEKLGETFLGMIHLALGFIRLPAKTHVNRAQSIEKDRSGKFSWNHASDGPSGRHLFGPCLL